MANNDNKTSPPRTFLKPDSSMTPLTTTTTTRNHQRGGGSGSDDRKQKQQQQRHHQNNNNHHNNKSKKAKRRKKQQPYSLLIIANAVVFMNVYYGMTIDLSDHFIISKATSNFEYAASVIMTQGGNNNNNNNNNPIHRELHQKQQERGKNYWQQQSRDDDGDDSNDNNNSMKKKKKKIPKELRYISPGETWRRDYFSASWLLNRERFLQMDTDKIQQVEGAAFVAAWKKNKPFPHAKLLYDWTDFSVEHLSKWWGMLSVFNKKISDLFPHVISILQNYLRRQLSPSSMMMPPTTTTTTTTATGAELKNTIAMVAFQPYKAKLKMNDVDGTIGRTLTPHALAASIVPLFKAGFGRVVVVGTEEGEHEYTREACRIIMRTIDEASENDRNDVDTTVKGSPVGKLSAVFNNNGDVVENNNNNSNTNAIATIEYSSSSSSSASPKNGNNSNDDNGLLLSMEVAHVKIKELEWKQSPGHHEHNIPRAAVIGMQLALTDKLNPKEYRIEWLGHRAPGYWKYVYLTEPDTILNMNHDLLPLFRKALDDGISLFPHRLHPLPHESDLPSNTTLSRGMFLPDQPPFSPVVTLDPASLGSSGGGNDDEDGDYISCCDGGKSAPGMENWNTNGRNNTGCSERQRWWACGFRKLEKNEAYNLTEMVRGHERLLSYKWMRLNNGIGVAVGSSNHGRWCIPSKTSCDENENDPSRPSSTPQ